MATYTNLNIPKLANAALEGLVKALLPLSTFSRNYSSESVDRTRGNSVLVPLTAGLIPIPFAGNYAISGGTKSVVTVTLDKHSFVSVGQDDISALNNSESSLESFFYQAGRALGVSMVTDVLTLVTTSNFGFATSTAGTALDVAHIRKAKLILDQANCPGEGRFALIDAVGMDALLAVTNFVQAQMFADNRVLQEGRVMRALGFEMHQLNSLFTPAANSVMAFVGHPQAIAVGMRYVRPQKPGEYEFAEAFSDPTTGATFGIRKFYDTAAGSDFLILECNWGKSVGISNCGRIIGLNA
jgi:acyl-coenzyme A thioesterase PaaI-like protein